MDKSQKLVVTGAAGLVGQNLITLLLEHGYSNIVAMDKHEDNLAILKRLNPSVTCVPADLSREGDWRVSLEGARSLVQLHAQITSSQTADFVRNNEIATRHVLKACHDFAVPYVVHISSSVVNSVADDDYTNTKKRQEKMVVDSGLDHVILRPTLMFGWFDPKHLGWLSRFMEKVPVFPIPGDGRYTRQPLYNRDCCRVIAYCLEHEPKGKVFDLVGQEEVDYIDIIRAIKRVKGSSTPVICIPYGLFSALMTVYGWFSASPPFTPSQLKALTAGDMFTGVDMQAEFGINPTSFEQAIEDTFTDPRYKDIVLER